MPTLSEAESKRLLAGFGVPIVDEHLVDDADGAVAAARALGGPVAVKLCGAGIAHKTERGLVRLGVEGDDAVRRAADELLAAASPEDGDVGVLVSRMVRGTRELIAGLARDPQLGMTVMLGIGGVLAEAVADVAFRLTPIEPVDVDELVDDLAAQRLLAPFRGESAIDRGVLADVLLGLSRLAEARPDVVSVDINPLVVAAGRPVAVDALVEVGTE